MGSHLRLRPEEEAIRGGGHGSSSRGHRLHAVLFLLTPRANVTTIVTL